MIGHPRRRPTRWQPATLSIIVIAFSSFVPARASAQQTLPVGSIVRIRWDDGSEVKGRLVSPLSRESETVHYCPYPAPRCTQPDDDRIRQLPASGIASIATISGSRWKEGAAVGAAIFAGTSLFLASVGGCGRRYDDDLVTCPALLVLGSATGALFGALIGSGVDTWGRIYWQP